MQEPLQLENRFWDCTGEALDNSKSHCAILANDNSANGDTKASFLPNWHQLYLLLQSTGVAAVVWLFAVSASRNKPASGGGSFDNAHQYYTAPQECS